MAAWIYVSSLSKKSGDVYTFMTDTTLNGFACQEDDVCPPQRNRTVLGKRSCGSNISGLDQVASHSAESSTIMTTTNPLLCFHFVIREYSKTCAIESNTDECPDRRYTVEQLLRRLQPPKSHRVSGSIRCCSSSSSTQTKTSLLCCESCRVA